MIISCRFCESTNIRKFGLLAIQFADIPVNEHPVRITIDRQRYQCKACRKTFFESLPEINEKRQCTKQLIAWLIQEAFKQSFVDLARQTGLNESTIRRIFEDYAKTKGVFLSAKKAVKALENLNSLKLTDEVDRRGEE